ncbi:TonB-dependent receptor [Novosphingobium mangrovi (ex Huang et al. 2023)]|uniref:TonB-dependent receptor n=1 Tax=Novosphingobium mangrovi (ex Huang et al. 2023) TaxID=2976432 RepID=A0ABT2I6H2_9SPHN|nr:TonB-dependent receptor [Novosphingobium mangrovi (ex Huang et al. 2023)]MCT2400198.1 TonB-dependent receptor [Novosphingobium mangrovi (ex Huang et al. 2023)]
MKLHHRRILLAATALGGFAAAPAMGQSVAQGSANDIIVTAQRIEQRLQDVPISVTVFNQDQIDNNAVSNIKDLAQYTPGLQVNNRYGADSTNFSIRGFTQEQRTTATVGVYFADVVAPRGSGASFGGDGAGPGALFDLQNVQVLKGPQGTLFGRNSTGGAVLLVPKKPTDVLEGYVEGTAGDYDLLGVQAVLNIPLADTFKVRLGGEHKERDGYLRNIGNLGDGRYGSKGMGNLDYWTFRASVVADLTPDLENYTVATYTKSKSNGTIPKILDAYAGVLSSGIPFGDMADAQYQREAAYGPWTVSNRLPDSQSTIEQWQIINKLTWQASDNITVKNILSYGEFRGKTNLDLFGTYFLRPDVPYGTETSGSQVTGFAFTHINPYTRLTNAQSTFVGELQVQGVSDSGRLNWQVGAYSEISDPLGKSGVQTATFSACNDIDAYDCSFQILPDYIAPGVNGYFSFGSINGQLSKTKFEDYAVYGQASYDITDQLKFTAGLRYTWDKQTTDVQQLRPRLAQGIYFCGSPIGVSNTSGTTVTATTPFPISTIYNGCHDIQSKKSKAPTWLVGLDYKPMEDLLIYAKWTRGYRQGGLSIFSPDTTQPYDKEKVDTYELGLKASWRGVVPGSFNISGFYNDFTNQQLLLGVQDLLPNYDEDGNLLPVAPPSASIVNSGSSTLQGFEAELNLRPFDGMRLGVAYGYLKTKIKELVAPTFAPGSPYDTVTLPNVGDPIPNAQPHKLTVSAAYTLPLPESVGDITLGGTWIYTGKFRSVADGCPTATTPGCPFANPGAGMVPSSNVLNLNLNWNNVGGMPVDAALFVTNVTKEVVILNINENTARGFRSGLLGEPRMWGVRLKYRFGQ